MGLTFLILNLLIWSRGHLYAGAAAPAASSNRSETARSLPLQLDFT